MIDSKEMRRVLGFANGNPNVVADIGNALVKVATDAPIIGGRNPLAFEYFTHGIVEVVEADYLTLCYYYEGKNAYHLIKWDGRFFVVGDAAYSTNPSLDPLRGRLKYTKDYYGIIFMSALLRLFNGNPPESINAFLAHPPADRDFTTELMRSVAGVWRFESNGQRFQIRVEYANAFDEIVGGVFNATFGPDGRIMNDLQILGDGPTLVFDMGGGSLDLARLKRDGSVDYDKRMESERTGVNIAINSFKSLFDRRYKGDLGDAEDGISRDLIIEIFLDEKHTLRTGGETLDCADIYKQAINPVIRTAKDTVNKFARGLIGYNRALLDGGGSGLLYDEICEQIFPKFAKNGVVHQADLRRDMFKANARGALKMLPGMMQESERRYAQLSKVKR